jgi:HPt (histidine-containing phosphotransfer) domain-containing protein
MTAGVSSSSLQLRSEAALDPAVFGELRQLGQAPASDFLVNLVNQFVRDTERQLKDLRKAFGGSDARTVSELAHTIRGSAGQMGGRRLSLSCGYLEAEVNAGRLLTSGQRLRQVEADYEEMRRVLRATL